MLLRFTLTPHPSRRLYVQSHVRECRQMRFSLIHPSRNRVALAEQALVEWTGKASGRHDCEYILSIDDDDGDIEGYRRIAARRHVELVIDRNRSLVDAVNRGATLARGDVLIVVSDDFGCPEQWDIALAEVIGERRDVAVLVSDQGDARIMTLPIVGRILYQEIGWLYHPEYFSMFADDDLTATVSVRNRLIDARHLVFPHRHYALGGNRFDATYARQNSSAAWRAGRRVFQKRRRAQFGLRSWSVRLQLEYWIVDVGYFANLFGGRWLKRQ